MVYSKPHVLAQNGSQGVYAAGCGSFNTNFCTKCEHVNK